MKRFAVDFLDPDAVKKAPMLVLGSIATLLFLTDKSPWMETVRLFLETSCLMVFYLHKVQKRYWSRFHPDSSSETILPLYDRTPRPLGMYIQERPTR